MRTIFLKSATVLTLIISAYTSTAQIAKAEIQATGLTCSMCSNAINKQLKTIVGIDSVGTDLNTNTFTTYLSPQSAVTPKILKDAVEKAGFFVGSMVLNVPANFLKDNAQAYIPVGEIKAAGNKEIKVKILDKGYITQKAFKKTLKSLAAINTYNTDNELDFHYKVLN